MGQLIPLSLKRGIGPVRDAALAEEEDRLITVKLGEYVLLIDGTNFKLDGKAPAAVLRNDGSIGIEYAHAEARQGIERFGFYRETPSVEVGCIILGKVISYE